MKNFKKFTLGILGATILSLGLYACSNDDAVTDNTTEQQAAMTVNSYGGVTDLIPVIERDNIYEYFSEYYQITDGLETLFADENLNLDADFYNRLQEIEDTDQLIDLLVEYNFSDSEIYVNHLQRISDMQIELTNKNEVFYTLSEIVREEIVGDILDISFNDYYMPITIARTCKEQYDIDVSRAKKRFGACSGFAIAAAGLTGGIGGLLGAGACMTDYYFNLEFAKEDYIDCMQNS